VISRVADAKEDVVRLSPKQRLWALAALGILVPVGSFRDPNDLIVGTVIVDAVLLAGGLLAVLGLLGIGPLRLKPTAAATTENLPSPPGAIDQLFHLARMRQSGLLSEDEFEAQKRRIIGE
jgi:hypothetical protein